MKALHDPSWYCWSSFDEDRDIDFNSYVWVREAGNLVVDPLPMSAHDRAHLEGLGGAAWIVVTNSDHLRDSAALAAHLGARVAGPAAERASFGGDLIERWLGDGDELEGAKVLALDGSKTPGELALVVGDVLVTGDLVRAHRAGSLMMLPDAKLKDPAVARESVRRLAVVEGIEAVLVGDGWPVFERGHDKLVKLASSLA